MDRGNARQAGLVMARREILAAEHRRLVRIGDRARAKETAAEARRIVNEILRRQTK